MDTKHNNRPVGLYEPLEELLESGKKLSLHNILSQFEHRSYGFAIFILSLVIVIPTGIVPGVAIVTSGIVLIVIVQYVVGRSHFYLPHFVDNHTIARASLVRVVSFLKKHNTLLVQIMGTKKQEVMFHLPYSLVTGSMLVFIALSTVPLTFVFFVEAIPGALMMLFGLAILASNSKLLVVSWVLSGVYLFFVFQLLQYILSFM